MQVHFSNHSVYPSANFNISDYANGCDIFDFSETAQRNSTKLDTKQDFNVLYKVCGNSRGPRNKTFISDVTLAHRIFNGDFQNVSNFMYLTLTKIR